MKETHILILSQNGGRRSEKGRQDDDCAVGWDIRGERSRPDARFEGDTCVREWRWHELRV